MLYCYYAQTCTGETIHQVGIILLVVAVIILIGLGISAWRWHR
ncbi:hypothetical protein SEA_MAGRITTE_57 [Microbacterium phage Magritte]|nr:hypothetical protein SEA_MAGRITTE_57 [Microbacterium phage Magritte]